MSSVSLPTYLLLTPKGYFFRLRVPKRLQAKLGKRELKKAITGTDRRLAERQAILYAAQALALFNSMEDATLSDSPYTQKMVVNVNSRGTDFILDKNNTAEELKILLQALIDQGLMSPGQKPLPTLLNPEVSAQPPSSSRVPETQDQQANQEDEPIPITPDMPLSLAIEVYIDELKDTKKEKFTEQKQKELRSKCNLLKDIIGDKPIGNVGYFDAKKYRTVLTELPTTRPKGMDLDALRASSGQKLSPNTVTQRIQTASSMFSWLNLVDNAIRNPFQNMSVDENEAAIKKRLPFDSEDLTNLFSYRIWAQKKFTNSWEYWLPLILLHTGARITETLQLTKDDFAEIDGIWCMSINDNPTKDEPEALWPWKKHLKNINSKRDIPIHSQLLALGLRMFVETSKTERIFPNIKPRADRLAHYPCKRFNENFLPAAGVKVKNKKTLYSFRHTVLNALKQMRTPSEERAQLAGHAVNYNNVTESVYGSEFNIKLMQELVERLDFSESIQSVQPW